MPALDKLVFDVGVFDGLYAIPLLYKVSINREHRKVAAGEAVEITIHIQGGISNGQRYSLNPATLPTINIYKPDFTLLVTAADMYNNGEVGLFTYQHQVSVNDVRSICC